MDALLPVCTADVVVVVTQTPHEHFTREGQNLIYRHALTLEKALTGSTVSVPLLGGRSVTVSLQEIIRYGESPNIVVPLSRSTDRVSKNSPSYRKTIAGEGLPLPLQNGQPQLDPKTKEPLYGDLILTFDITFPSYLSVKQKEIIKQVFAAS